VLLDPLVPGLDALAIVRLARFLAREPLGLTFIGRGFDVRIGAPLNHSIEEGLQKIADECVRNCPTGALTK